MDQPRARDLMSKDVLTVDPYTTVRDYIALIREKGFSALPVVDGERRPLGVVSHSDVLRGLVAFLGAEPLPDGPGRRRIGADLIDLDEATPPRIADYLNETVQTIMEHDVATCAPDAAIKDVCQAMTARRIRRIIVVDNELVVGVVSASDVVTYVATR